MNEHKKALLKLQSTTGLKSMRDACRQVIQETQEQLKAILEELHERERAEKAVPDEN